MLAATGVPFLDANYLADIKECIKDLLGSFFYDPYQSKKFATEEAESGDDAEDDDDDGIDARFSSCCTC